MCGYRRVPRGAGFAAPRPADVPSGSGSRSTFWKTAGSGTGARSPAEVQAPQSAPRGLSLLCMARKRGKRQRTAEQEEASAPQPDAVSVPTDRLWTVYVPAVPDDAQRKPAQPTYEQQQQVGLPYGREVFPGDPLLVVVSCPAHLLAARLARENGSHVVVWAWLCSEVLARQAEIEFPVVYGIPTAEQVAEAAAAGPQEQPTTSVCLRLESAFRIPERL